jgi:TolA-binding protein
VLVVLGALLTLPGCQQPRKPQKDQQFQDARQLVVDGKYRAAVPALEKYIDQEPNHKNASRAGLFLFKAHLAQGQFDDAAKWCQWTIRQHPASLEAHKCRYKLAVLALVQGQHDDARQQFADMAKNPDGPLAAEAAAMAKFLGSVDFQPRDAEKPVAAE